MTIFISWNKADDAAFRAYYFEKTGEKIQAEPIDTGSGFQIGSSRLSDEDIAELVKFAGVAVANEPQIYANISVENL